MRNSLLPFGVTASPAFARASGFTTIRRTVQLTPRLSGRWRVTWVVERLDFFRGKDARVGVEKRLASFVQLVTHLLDDSNLSRVSGVAWCDFFQGEHARVAQRRTLQVGLHFFLEGQCCSFK